MLEKFWRFENKAGGKAAELLLYGDLSSRTWYGDEITARQFQDDLKALGDVEEITCKINSPGGDVFCAVAIGNELKQHQAHITAVIEGCCCSAATIVTSCCDTVKAAPGTVFMVHPVKLALFDYYGASELQNYIDALAAIRDGILEIYANKTGRGKDEAAELMDATTWMTPTEAREHGFVDEVMEGGSATIENRAGALFINSVDAHMAFQDAPEFIRNGVGRAENKSKQEEKQMEQNQTIQTVDQLRAAYPELVDQIEQAAAEKGKTVERERIHGIENITLPGSEELAEEAKYTKPVSVSDYAVALAKNMKTQGAAFLAAMQEDAKGSGAEGVGGTPAPDGENSLDATRANAKAAAEAYKKGRK